MADLANSELNEFFEQAPNAEPAPEPVEPPAPEPELQPEPEPAPEPEPEPEQPRGDDGRFVPVKAVQEEREKRRALEDRIRELEGRQTQQPQTPIDPYDDPEGFRAQLIAENQVALATTKLELSDSMARQVHGSEKVDAAVAWALERAQADPAFGPRYMAQPNPIDFIVRQHDEATEIDRYRADPVAFARSVLERHNQAAPTQAAPVLPASPVAAPAQPPKSIASAPSTQGGIGDVPLGTKAAVDEVFKR